MDRRKPSEPPESHFKIDVTITVPRQLVWLVAGVTIGALRVPDGLLETASFILRTLLLA